MFIVIHRVRLRASEMSVTFFWLYYASVHLGAFIGHVILLVKYTKENKYRTDLKATCLHLGNAALCIGVFLIHACTSFKDSGASSLLLGSRAYSITDELPLLALKYGVVVDQHITIGFY
jgi:hypothetical protein